MPLALAQATVLFAAPLRGHAIEECGVDTSVELVDVHRVKPVLKEVVLGLQSGDGLLVVTFLVGVALSQRHAHPVEHFVVKGQPPEQTGELLFEHLFTNVRLVAFSLVAGAVIVDVLDLGDDRATAMTAFDQTGERELVLGAAMALGVPAVENVLHPLPQAAAHDRLVAPLIDAAVPLELAHVDARAQHPVDGAERQGIAAPAEAQALRPRLSGNLPERQGAGCIPFEQPCNDWSQLRIWLDQPLAVRPGHVAITERGERRPDTLLGLFQHALVHLLRQVVDVVLRHQHLDAVHELLGGARVTRQHDAFLDEVEFEIKLVERHPILEVAVEPVGLFDEQDTGVRVRLEAGDHLAEAGAAGLLGGLDIHVLVGDGEALGGGIVAKQLELRRDGETLFLLLLRGNTRIGDCSAQDRGGGMRGR